MSGKNKKALRFASLFLLVFMLLSSPASAVSVPEFSEDSSTVLLRGRVLSVEELEPEGEQKNFVQLEQLAEVEITRGPYKGQRHTILNSLTGHPLFDLRLTAGKRVLLWGEVSQDGTLRQVYLQDYARDHYLYLVIGLFVLALVVVGRRKGVITVLTLIVTLFAVWQVLLPLLLRGYSPIPVTVLVAAVITIITLLAIGGLQRKTFAAAIGTVGGVLVAGTLAYLVGGAANLTGFSSEDAQMLLYLETSIDVRGLLFAGIIIGALGAVMDVAMSISASSHEVYCVNPAICMRDQIKSAMNVGRDVMGTMANTLILAYVGTAMPLLLLFMGHRTPYTTVFNSDLVATEVVRALTGSIGIVSAIPLTAVASGLLTARPRSHRHGHPSDINT